MDIMAKKGQVKLKNHLILLIEIESSISYNYNK